MQEQVTNNNEINNPIEIDLIELFYILLKEKWTIFSISSIFSILGLIFSLLLPNIYASKAILAPVDSSSSISSSLQNYSGLAGLAGISLPSVGAESNSKKAIKKLSSLSFFEENILPNIFLPNLMAVKSWNYKTNSLSYDEGIYNKKSNTWVRDFSYPSKQVPSAQESYKVFQEKHLAINEDKQTGFITLTVKHQSPYIAKQWTETIINEVNSFYREKDKTQSLKTVSYLNKQMAVNNLSEVKQVISELIQQETQKLALVEANQSYVFEYIDPPAIMEKKSEPKRALICILSLIIGVVLSFLIIILKHYFYREKVL